MLIQRNPSVNDDDSALLKLDRHYTVYAVLLGKDPKFLVCDEEVFSFPFFVSSTVVEVVDPCLSRLWRYISPLPSTDAHSSRQAMLAFAAFEQDPRFYQDLVDGCENAVRVWERVKAEIDDEALVKTVADP